MTLIIGITGPSGAGKSTLARAILEVLGPGRSALMVQDDYYRDLSHLEVGDRARRNFDDPASLELDLLADHLKALHRGELARCPIYDFSFHTRVEGKVRVVEPKEVILVEGILLGAEPGVLEQLDLLVYIGAPREERLSRRVLRDVAERGRTEASVIRQWEEQVEPATRAFVGPLRERADLVVDGTAPLEHTLALVLERIPG